MQTRSDRAPAERFSNRVANYVKYRPHYPDELLPLLRTKIGLQRTDVIADVGSGTGISAEPFLANGNTVFGIEPNKPMRIAGEDYLQSFADFHSINATAESTTLPDRSIDLIVAGQAFHWFQPTETREEFRRILRGAGWTVLIWNDRQTDTTDFLRDYEHLLQEFGTDYKEINHRNIDLQKITQFFERSPEVVEELPYLQRVNYEGLEGRLLSSSYVPNVGEPGYETMIDRLQEVFNAHAREGIVDLRYTTLIYASRLLNL